MVSVISLYFLDVHTPSSMTSVTMMIQRPLNLLDVVYRCQWPPCAEKGLHVIQDYPVKVLPAAHGTHPNMR